MQADQSEAQDQMTRLSVSLPSSLHDRLAELASENERSFAAEVRVALRRYANGQVDEPLVVRGAHR